MRRVLLASLTLIALGLMSGCSNSNNNSSSTGTTTQANSLLSGQYAFVLNGYDSTGNSMGMAGSFTADGNGHITAGDVDVNDNEVVSSATGLTGAYAFDPGAGPIGKITLTNTVGSVLHPLEFSFAINSAGTFGGISDLSANNFVIAGTMQQQSASVFTLANLAGPYIVTVNGRNAAQAASALGSFTLGANGATTGDSFDVSVSGVGTAGPTAGSATFASTGMDASGRGTFTLALNDGGLTAATLNFAYYAISSSSTAGRFVAVETDGNGTMIVDASRQTALPATATTAGSAFGMAGLDIATSSEISTVGQLQIVSGSAGTVVFDSNDNGAINSVLGGLSIVPGAYNATTGRGTATISSGPANGFAGSLVFYLTAAGTGFIMDNSAGTDRAMAGTLTAQTSVGAFATATDLTGASIIRAKGVATTDAQSFIGEFGLTTTAGIYALVADERFPSSSTITTQTDTSISPITIGSLSATTGRGTLLAGSETLAFYVVGVNQFVFIDISPTGNANNGPTPLFFATPD